MKNFLIIGPPRSGKTTLIKELSKILKGSASGFYTEEIKEEGERVGFLLCTLEGEKKLFAHKDIKSPYRVGKYGVCIDVLENIGLPQIIKGIDEKEILIIDEIGKMELFSSSFKEVVMKAFSSTKKVVATMKSKECPFTKAIKERNDTKIFYTPSKDILKELLSCLMHAL